MKRFLLWIISVALGVVVLLAAVMGVSYAFTTEGGCPDGAAQFGGQALEANGSCWQVPLLGGVFVGVGVGLIVRQGGSSGGDDALALVIHKLTGWRLSRAYLFTDLTVLFASLSYIPFRRIAFSLVTVTVSSLLIDFVKEWQPKTNV